VKESVLHAPRFFLAFPNMRRNDAIHICLHVPMMAGPWNDRVTAAGIARYGIQKPKP
jgi:hypothetical protein